jgi:hypothetical protein
MTVEPSLKKNRAMFNTVRPVIAHKALGVKHWFSVLYIVQLELQTIF